MKQIEITLKEYLDLGGKLENVDWSNSYIDNAIDIFSKKIISCSDIGEKNNTGGKLINLTFADGTTCRCAISLIKTKVDFILLQTYKELLQTYNEQMELLKKDYNTLLKEWETIRKIISEIPEIPEIPKVSELSEANQNELLTQEVVRLKSVLSGMIDYHRFIGNRDVNITHSIAMSHLYHLTEKGLLDTLIK